MSSNRDGKRRFTLAALKKILGVGAPADGTQRRSLFVEDPATGALVVRPEYDLKIQKALRAEAKRIQQRLYLRYLRLQLTKFLLQRRLLFLIARNKLRSVLAKLTSNGYG